MKLVFVSCMLSMLLASFIFGEFGFAFYAIPALRFVGKEKNAGNLAPEILDTRFRLLQWNISFKRDCSGLILVLFVYFVDVNRFWVNLDIASSSSFLVCFVF
jgi:hypothetical protein